MTGRRAIPGGRVGSQREGFSVPGSCGFQSAGGQDGILPGGMGFQGRCCRAGVRSWGCTVVLGRGLGPGLPWLSAWQVNLFLGSAFGSTTWGHGGAVFDGGGSSADLDLIHRGVHDGLSGADVAGTQVGVQIQGVFFDMPRVSRGAPVLVELAQRFRYIRSNPGVGVLTLQVLALEEAEDALRGKGQRWERSVAFIDTVSLAIL